MLIEDCEISFPGGGTAEEARNTVPDDEARYPEQFFFGTLPSWDWEIGDDAVDTGGSSGCTCHRGDGVSCCRRP